MKNKRLFETIDSQEHSRINSKLSVVLTFDGLLGNKVWDRPYSALDAVEGVLKKHGISISGERPSFTGDDWVKTYHFPLAREGKKLSGVQLVYEWGKADDVEKYAITAYLS